jgi:hypothetical protein
MDAADHTCLSCGKQKMTMMGASFCDNPACHSCELGVKEASRPGYLGELPAIRDDVETAYQRESDVSAEIDKLRPLPKELILAQCRIYLTANRMLAERLQAARGKKEARS